MDGAESWGIYQIPLKFVQGPSSLMFCRAIGAEHSTKQYIILFFYAIDSGIQPRTGIV